MVWKFYTNLLKKQPLLTQMITTGVLAGSGDLIAQTVIEKRSVFRNDIVYERTLRFFGLGCFFVAPSLRYWYIFLERNVHVRQYPKLTPLLRVVIDQATFGPCFMSLFLVLLRKLEGNDLSLAIEKWQRDFLDIFKNGLKIWPAAQMINFYFVPLPHRLLFVQTVALIWNTYLAWRTNLVLPIVEKNVTSQNISEIL